MSLPLPTPTALQFGAGNIGRGFLGQLFHESGLEVVFVDVSATLIEGINRKGAYNIRIVGDGAETVPIDRVRAVSAVDTAAVAAEVARAEIICTAVGASILPRTAPAIAAGLAMRHACGGPAVNILLCENLHNAAEVLRDAVAELLPADIRSRVLLNTGFVQAVVSRMVPLQTDEYRAADPLAIRVEAYKRLPLDADAWIGETPASRYVGFEAVRPFEAYVERKLFTHNCAHAVLGYLGYLGGFKFGYQALDDPDISFRLNDVMRETGQALIRKHGFDPQEHREHVEDLLCRFDNRDLGDTCLRLARDPIRKLAPMDRIVGAARCCESQGIVPEALAYAIAAALWFDDPNDPSSQQLQSQLRERGPGSVLETVCGILPDEPLGRMVTELVE